MPSSETLRPHCRIRRPAGRAERERASAIHMLGLDAVEPSPRDALRLFSEQLGLPVGCSLRHVNEVGEPDFGEHQQLAIHDAAKD